MTTHVTQFETERFETEQLESGEAQRRLIEAETEYQRLSVTDFIALRTPAESAIRRVAGSVAPSDPRASSVCVRAPDLRVWLRVTPTG